MKDANTLHLVVFENGSPTNPNEWDSFKRTISNLPPEGIEITEQSIYEVWNTAYHAITKLAVISPHEQFEAYCAANNLEYHYNRPTQSIYIRLKPLSATRNPC